MALKRREQIEAREGIDLGRRARKGASSLSYTVLVAALVADEGTASWEGPARAPASRPGARRGALHAAWSRRGTRSAQLAQRPRIGSSS